MVVAFVSCNFLVAAFNIISIVFGHVVFAHLFYRVLLRVTNLMVLCVPSINFFLYSIVSSDYRRTLKRILHVGEAETISQTTKVVRLSANAGPSHIDP
jgi:hypothetical protein